uniref:Uncharacterized protein n=1 Tax=Siphoviridae sp. ctt0c4 TaxID=2825702 RepID=A0A8S5V361_9CAUD|nr:MAG TPA: hypothetical protein [Siphoviridae sp. ctt0c4]
MNRTIYHSSNKEKLLIYNLNFYSFIINQILLFN